MFLLFLLSQKTLSKDSTFIVFSTNVLKFSQSDEFAEHVKDEAFIRETIVANDTFTIEAGQELFDKLYTKNGKHLFKSAVVDCIGEIAKNGSLSPNNLVCSIYDGFHKDYKKFELLRASGYVVPACSTIYGWLTGKHSTCRLIMLNSVSCLLNSNGFMRPLITVLDKIIELVVACGISQYEGGPAGIASPPRPMGYLVPFLKRFMVHDTDSVLLTALLQSVSLSGKPDIRKNPGPSRASMHGDSVSGKMSGIMGGVRGDAMSGVSGGVVYQNCTIASPPPQQTAPKNVRHNLCCSIFY